MPDSAVAEPPAADAAPRTGEMLNDSLRTRLEAAMKGKGDVATAPPVVPVAPAKPAEPAAPAAPAAEPAAPVAPVAKTKPALPASDTYVPGSTHKADWERIKSERDAARAEAVALKNAAAQVPPDVTKTLAELKKERDEYQAQLRAVAIERDPAFDREFASATATVTAMARNTVGDAAKVDALFAMPLGPARDKAIAEIMEPLPPYKQLMLGNALADMEKIALTRQAKVEEARANWGRLQQEAAIQQAARESESKAKLESLIAQWSDPEKGFAHLKHKAGDEAHNARVDGTIALARDIFAGQLDMEQMARASVWAASAEQLLTTIRSLEGEKTALEARIGELTGVAPGAGDAGTGGTVAAPGAEDALPPGTDFAQAVAAGVRKQGLLR